MSELEKDLAKDEEAEATKTDASTEEAREAPKGEEPKEGAQTEELKEPANEPAETEEAKEPAEAEAEEGEEGKKSWAERRAEKKQAKEDKKIDEQKLQIDQLQDKVKRQLAEFENFRKRSEREKETMFETGARSVIEKILPVVDNFERGLATVNPEQENDAFVDGMNKVYKQLIKELDAIGVKPIEAVGKEFDPNLHNAVMQVESEEYESGIVAAELQKGYTYRDTVVRHSMVSVVQ
ncbi:MAG: nucleotide exchange factor GrpE [Lachnospiraceae bacterium]|nr:nucleotide exchange factor GrpE [Lachnospiraceae bacterium]